MSPLNPDNPSPAPADPQLEAMLDRILGPEALPGGVPAHLVDRVCRNTADALRDRQLTANSAEPPVVSRVEPPAVIGRIGFRIARYAAAAVVLLAAVGVWFTWTSIDSAQQLHQLDARLTQLAAAQQQDAQTLTTPIDTQINQLATHVNSFALEDNSWSATSAAVNQSLNALEQSVAEGNNHGVF